MPRESFASKYGPWALVTGASSGIGLAAAREAAARALNIVLVARSAARLDEIGEEIHRVSHVSTRSLACDLADPADRARLIAATRDLDIGLLIAAAGFGTSGPLIEADAAVERSMLEVNAAAVVEQCIEFGRRFAKRGSGGIVLMSSLVAWQGVPRAAHYAATKAYVQSLAEAFHIEMKPHGVDVLASAPGPVRSGFGARADMRMTGADDATRVARATLDALGRKATVVPGAIGRFLTASLLPFPRRVRVRILARSMAGMTRHRQSG